MIISEKKLKDLRRDTFRLSEGRRLQTQNDAIAYVQERGFVYFWPIKGVLFPSLWTAVAGNRPVADKHDDPGHVTWGWKDELLGQKKWHYAKVLRGKATMIALDLLPTFYALTENYGDPEQDYLLQYEDGLLSREAKVIYEKLLLEGPLDTVNLRRKIGMTGKKSNSPFERGLTHLQRDFKIMPVGVADTGSWGYSFVYDLVPRQYPDLIEAARPVTRKTARLTLLRHYFWAMGVADALEVKKLFQWRPADVLRTLSTLEENGELVLTGGTEKRPVYTLPRLLSKGG